MIEYKAEDFNSPTGAFKVVQYLDDQRITTVAYAINELWAQRIANALNQMEIES